MRIAQRPASPRTCPSLAALLTATVALLAGPAFAAGLTCAIPAVPSGARVEMVVPEMRDNGVASTVRAVESSLTVDGTIAFYRALWAPLANASRPGSLEQTIQGWRVISTVDGNCFTTVQVRSQGMGSYALVSVAQRPNPTTQRSSAVAQFPLPAGGRILRDTDYKDDVRNARTVVVAVRNSPAATADYYLSTLQAQGWVVQLQRQPESGSSRYVLAMKRGLEELNIVIAPAKDGDGVTVVANITDRP